MKDSAACEEVRKLGLFGRIRSWIKRQIITEVPDGIARCEFECRLAKCSPDRIRDCENRIAYEKMLSTEKIADK